MAGAGLHRGVWNPRIGGTGLSSEAAKLLGFFDGRQPRCDTREKRALSAMDCALDPEQLARREGRLLIREHLVRERNQALSRKKKQSVLGGTGRLACEACSFTVYGEHFAECHGHSLSGANSWLGCQSWTRQSDGPDSDIRLEQYLRLVLCHFSLPASCKGRKVLRFRCSEVQCSDGSVREL